MTHALYADDALLPHGWARRVLLRWDEGGKLIAVLPDALPPDNVPRAPGPLLPGMPNLHSHAFQRAMGGLTEYRGRAQDSFWSWRELMYRYAGAVSPEQLEALAFGLYVEMLEAGYTSVCEFHYVHHDVGGRPYADGATLLRSLMRAAARAGIGLTLLPVLYHSSGFGGTPALAAQRRFVRTTDDMLRLLGELRPACEAAAVRLGVAPHSLRAVPPAPLRALVEGLTALDPQAPIHIHIAEQMAEVVACQASTGQRPVQWLLEHLPVDRRWCLVHATHMLPDEYLLAAQSGAVAGLCPSTEANLGDGLFDMPAWRDAGGAWGVGSDSHTTVNAAEELMLLEYGQRLATHSRNVLAHADHRQVATAATLEAVSGGAQACARPVAGLAVGQQADLVALDATHPLLQGLPDAERQLAAHVFASHRQSAIAAVWAAGRPLVRQGRHEQREIAQHGFVQARRQLLEVQA